MTNQLDDQPEALSRANIVLQQERHKRILRKALDEYEKSGYEPVLEPSHFAPQEPERPMPPKQSGFWSRDFLTALVIAVVGAVVIGTAIGAMAWRAGGGQ